MTGDLSISKIGVNFNTDFLNGSIDEVKIWDRALTQEEIVEEMNSNAVANPDGIVAYYDFNEETGSVAYDNNQLVEGLNNIDPSNRAFGFDGIDDYITLNTDLINLSETSLTVSGWIKTNSQTGYNHILGDQVYKYSNPALYISNTGIPSFRVLWSRGSSSYGRRSSGEYGEVTNGVWSYLTGIYNLLPNGNYTVQLYVNGEPKEISTESLTSAARFQEWEIGRGEYNNGNYNTNGSIQNVRIYNRSLTEQEIKALYYGGLQNTFDLFEIEANINTFQAYVDSILYTTTEDYLVTNNSIQDKEINITITTFDFNESEDIETNLSQDYDYYFPTLRINATDKWRNTSLQNFTISIDKDNQPFQDEYSGVDEVNITVTNGLYTYEANKTGYTIANSTSVNLTEDINQTQEFYKEGDFYIVIRDADTNDIINTTTNITIVDTTSKNTNVTGSGIIENLTTGDDYSITFKAEGYVENQINIIYSHDLNINENTIYLQSNTTYQEVIFTVKDQLGDVVSDANVQISRYIDGVLTIVSNLITDFYRYL